MIELIRVLFARLGFSALMAESKHKGCGFKIVENTERYGDSIARK